MNMPQLINFIRQNASDEFQSRIPEVTIDNLATVTTGITNYQPFMNEAIEVLVNKIALVQVANKVFQNPLANLKKGGIPYGSDVQDIFTNIAVSKGYDPTGSGLLTATEPDVKAAIYRLNRQSQYPITVRQEQLKQAFTSAGQLNSLMDSIVTSLYSGDNTDEYLLMKNLFADAVTTGRIKSMECADVVDATTAGLLVKAIKTVSGLFKFIGSKFNAYYDFKADADNGKPCQTFCERANQVLLVRSDILTTIDVDVLSKAFNIDKVDFMGRVIEVDDFGMAINTMAVLIDESAIQVYDVNNMTSSQWNAHGLFWNYWLHRWQIYGLRLFANAQAFCVPSVNLELVSMVEGDATIEVVSTVGMVEGKAVAGLGIEGDTTVLSITDGTHFELSKPATASNTSGFLIALK